MRYAALVAASLILIHPAHAEKTPDIDPRASLGVVLSLRGVMLSLRDVVLSLRDVVLPVRGCGRARHGTDRQQCDGGQRRHPERRECGCNSSQ